MNEITDKMIYDAIADILVDAVSAHAIICQYDIDVDAIDLASYKAIDQRIKRAVQCACGAIASLPYDDPVPDNDAEDAEPYDGLS